MNIMKHSLFRVYTPARFRYHNRLSYFQQWTPLKVLGLLAVPRPLSLMAHGLWLATPGFPVESYPVKDDRTP